MEIKEISLKNGTALGVKIELQKAPLLVIRGKKGFVMCGYLDMKVAEVLGDTAARVKGVSSLDDIMKAEIVEVSSKAREIGIKEGMKGMEALEKMV